MMRIRSGMTEAQRDQWSRAACRHAADFVKACGAESIMIYVSFRGELDLSLLVEWCWDNGIDVIAPRCLAADRSMKLHRLRSWDQLAPGAYGIMEPDPALTPEIEPELVPKVVFVPGLAFDRDGGRLGYGGGYYDRFAEKRGKAGASSTSVIWIGAAYEAQLVEEVPLESHDMKMNGILTERQLYMA